MRILVQALVAAPGGSLTVLRDLVAAWPEGDDLLIVCWREEAAEVLRATGHPVLRVQARSTEHALLRMRIHRRDDLARFHPDVVWSQAVWVGGYAVPQAVHYRDIGSFVAIHPDSLRQRVKAIRERRDLMRADLRIYNSATMRDAVHGRYPTGARQPHEVIHNGLDLSHFAAIRHPRKSQSRANDAVRILLPQGDAPHKRNWLAADVLAYLVADDSFSSDVRLTVAGRGEYADLRAALARHGLERRAEFTGHVSRPEMAALYASHDVVLMTSIAESFGNPIVEAHVAGRPLVTAPFAVAQELAGPLLQIAAGADAASLARGITAAIREDGDRDAAVRWADRFAAGHAADRLRAALSSVSAMDRSGSRREAGG
jgi:glycosyltransferase involved in cell wall biosynthesis